MSRSGIDPRTRIEQTIRRFYDGCNEANAEKMRSCLAPDAVHFFPAGAPQGRFDGAEDIIEAWKKSIAENDSRWTIDRMLIDDSLGEAVVEWTHFKPRLGVYVRGDEWYRFGKDGRITEIRAYYACPTAAEPQVHELGGFDYVQRGYATKPPEVARQLG